MDDVKIIDQSDEFQMFVCLSEKSMKELHRSGSDLNNLMLPKFLTLEVEKKEDSSLEVALDSFVMEGDGFFEPYSQKSTSALGN